MRAKMIDWMIEVLTAFHCSHETFFLAVSLLDAYLTRTPQFLDNSHIHLLGIVSMFLASKHEDVRPLFMSQIVEKISQGSFMSGEIANMEVAMLNTLRWNCTHITPFNFIEYFTQMLHASFNSFKVSKILTSLHRWALQNARLAVIHYSNQSWKPSDKAVASYALAID